MTNENLCNDGRCKVIRMGKSRKHEHEKIENEEESILERNERLGEWNIDAKHAIKNMKSIIIISIIMA